MSWLSLWVFLVFLISSMCGMMWCLDSNMMWNFWGWLEMVCKYGVVKVSGLCRWFGGCDVDVVDICW